MSSPIMRHFDADHLPTDLREVSESICELAKMLDEQLPGSAEKSAGLRKLLEAKDCFVRAAVEKRVVACRVTYPTLQWKEK